MGMIIMIKLEDYLIPEGSTDEQIIDALKCPITRICNIYTIIDKPGQRVAFRPKRGQMKILHAIFILGWTRILVPKARQHGVSTLSEIILLDISLFTPDTDTRTGKAADINTPNEFRLEVQTQCSIVERSRDHAEKQMATIKNAWKHLPAELKAGVSQADPWNKGESTWTHGSKVIAGLNARGGTNNALHVSEWGVIAYNDPKRAKEIETGALPSVPKEGLVIGESTHMGGKAGAWYEKVTESLEVAEEDKTLLDFRVVFLGWYEEPEYSLEGRTEQITDEINQYLDKKQDEIGIEFTPGQRLWYYKTRESLKRDMFSEYPTTLEECWMAPSPGLIYASDMDRARGEGRITNNVAYYEQLPVYTNWDLGLPINTNCWLYQIVGDYLHCLEYLEGGDDCKTAGDWTKRLRAKSYGYGGHFLPHDGEVSWLNAFNEAELDFVYCLDRPVNVWQNINEALGFMSRVRFNKDSCKEGIKGLDAFHSKEENDGATVRAVPVHNWASHPSTSFGYIFQAMREGMHVDRSGIPSKARKAGNVVVTTGVRGLRSAIRSGGNSVQVNTSR